MGGAPDRAEPHGGQAGEREEDDVAALCQGRPAENAVYVGNDMHRDIVGAREAGMKVVMFDSDQGTKSYLDRAPDFTITDLRDLLKILDLP